MPTELEELVKFLHHGNTEIRQVAVENLVGLSLSQPTLFKKNQLEPIKDLKLLIKDYAPISKNVSTMLINLSSHDQEILKDLATDDAFLESMMLRITNQSEPNANELAMLLANMAKDDKMLRILQLKREVPKSLSMSPFAIDQLMDCFVKGAEGAYNKKANYDYLSYFFADLSQFPECRTYFLQPQERDNGIVPLTKLTVFTEHTSAIRRRGVASTIKNVAFEVPAHPRFVASSGADSINILPYILLPLMGPEEYSDRDTEGMLEDLQLLPPDKEREKDREICKAHLETLLLLTATRPARDHMRAIQVYPIIRETHAHVEHEEVREACDRLVQILMRDEEDTHPDSSNGRIEDAPKDEDDEIVEIF